ncbi:MAG: AEC family transporter [Usitatibacteraceae bacterium]
MTALAEKLLPIFLLAFAGFLFGRSKAFDSGQVTRGISNVAFYLFVPALLFRTTARIDLSSLQFSALAAFFVPTVLLMFAVVAFEHRRRVPGDVATVRALSVTFGNTVQIGIPVALAAFGEAGLAIHAAIIAVHSLVLLSAATVMIEWARREQGGSGTFDSIAAVLLPMVKQTLIHPVILPVVAGFAWNLLKLPLPGPVDATLVTLAQAAVPLCLVLIGLSMAHYGVKGVLRPALALTGLKLIVQPSLVAVAAFWLLPLEPKVAAVTVLCAALPIGANPLLFAQRYNVGERETTAAIAISTVLYGGTVIALLAMLTR